MIYLDFAKAFDKVDHKILLQKIWRLGFRGKIYNWLTVTRVCFLRLNSGERSTTGSQGFVSLGPRGRSTTDSQ